MEGAVRSGYLAAEAVDGGGRLAAVVLAAAARGWHHN